MDVNRLEVLKEIADSYNNLSNIQKAYDKVSDELEATKSKLLALSQQYNLKVCHNCGSVVS